MSDPTTFRIGTRGSRLALIQTGLVAERLKSAGYEVEVVTIVTTGDRRPAGSNGQEIAQDGWFTRALREALEARDIDLAVHSAKDLPIEAEPETGVVFPERADPRDALVTRARVPLERLPEGATVGTDSVRRAGFLRAARPDLRFVPLHGNVPTRVEKLDRGDADALVLAAAGLDRLGWGSRIDQLLDPELMPPAPAQGALAIEVRELRSPAGEAVAALDDPLVRAAVHIERSVLKAMGGGCRSPLGALADVVDGEVSLLAGVPGRVLRWSARLADQDRVLQEVTQSLLEEETWQAR
ncbi:MAG: hydroxymethylbilane synthase [Candidatus Dormibacteraeota bacterium]|nr:hydroxymethylbilane synthase [Candidatus Dormibacteraeota bacterium]